VTLIVREAGWQMRKNPALLTDRGEVVVILVSEPNETALEIITQSVHLSTGYVFLTKV